MSRLLVGCIVCLMAVPIARAEEKVENPAYKSWDQFAKGTAIVMKTVSDTAGSKTESTITTTLAEISDDKIVLEMVTTLKTGGKEMTTPPVKLPLEKMVALPAGTKKEDFGKPTATTEQGEETVKVGGTEYATKWYKNKTEVGEMSMETQAWTSDKVPGTVVKTVTKTSGKFGGTTTMELIEIKKP